MFRMIATDHVWKVNSPGFKAVFARLQCQARMAAQEEHRHSAQQVPQQMPQQVRQHPLTWRGLHQKGHQTGPLWVKT